MCYSEELSNINEWMNSSWGNNLLLKIDAGRSVTQIVAEVDLARLRSSRAQGDESVTNADTCMSAEPVLKSVHLQYFIKDGYMIL